MHSFFAMVWNDSDKRAAAEAADLRGRINETLGRDLHHIETSGFAVYDFSHGRDGIIALKNGGGRCAGAIYGRLFETENLSPSTRSVKELSEDATRKLCASGGGSLLRDYWGIFVAFIATDQGFSVITDPTSAIPCFVYEQSLLTLFFSHLEHCPFISRLGLTINDNFVARLLAYDKIQNGETGFNEVREMLGGERIRPFHGIGTPELLWDPGRIAYDVFEPSMSEAADQLRHFSISVVSAWAHSYGDISVNLSGGFDSAVLLACLAGTRGVGKLNALHFRLDSSDPPENHYAKTIAHHVGCELVEILESPAVAIPEVCEHPATARPYRQFAARDVATRMGKQASQLNPVLFTGQGGDHLFLHTNSGLQFADYLRRHGWTRTPFTQLLDAARLSEQSIWAVLLQSLPHCAGKSHESSVVASIEARKTVINRQVFDGMSIKDSLPIWVRNSRGLPPGKFDQVGSLLHMFQVRDPLGRAGDPCFIHPLISQPLIELCLRLPTYLLCAHGQSRGLARQAFAKDLPELIRTRRSKGDASRFFLAYLKHNSRAIVEALRDGELVARGMITRTDVEAFMKHSDYQIQTFGRMMLLYYTVEAWLRSSKRTPQASDRTVTVA